MQYTRSNYRITFAVTFILIGWLGLSAISTKAQSNLSLSNFVFDSKTDETVRLVAKVMEVNDGYTPSLIVAEKNILVTDFKIGNSQQHTLLIDENGLVVELAAFKKGQRVIVYGFTVSEDTIVGKSVQIKSKHK